LSSQKTPFTRRGAGLAGAKDKKEEGGKREVAKGRRVPTGELHEGGLQESFKVHNDVQVPISGGQRKRGW